MSVKNTYVLMIVCKSESTPILEAESYIRCEMDLVPAAVSDDYDLLVECAREVIKKYPPVMNWYTLEVPSLDKVEGASGMTGNEYQKLAMRTCSFNGNEKRSMLNHAVFGLTSEAGEVAGILQKEYQGHYFDPDHIEKELGDCLWMIAEACSALGFDMDDVMRKNIDKLKKRYPEGFSVERSLHREDGDI